MIDRGSDASLRKAMHESLRGGTVVVLATISPTGTPSTALCSWVVAKGTERLAMALDKRGAAYSNIAAGVDQVALEVMADGVLLGIRGRATIDEETMTSTPFPCALVCVDVTEIRSHMFQGIEFEGPRYLFAPGKEHRNAIERAIFEELEGA